MRYFFVILFSFIVSMANAQKEERQNIRAGNKLYEKNQYKEAEDAYKKALDVNSKSAEAYYNIGNSMYRQLKPAANQEISEEDKKRMTDTATNYKTAASLSQDKKQKAMAWHNIGNLFMLSGDYAQSVDAYKNSLLNNPADDETRYNYVLAKELLKNQQNQNQNQDQNKDKDKDKDKDQDKKDQDKDNKQDQDQNQNQDKDQQDKMSKDNAQQILDAMMQDEQKTQEKAQKAQRMDSRKQPEKDW